MALLLSAVAVSGCWLRPITDESNNVNTNTSQTCGGIAGIICPSGYECVYFNPTVPDGTGLCLPISDEVVNDNSASNNSTNANLSTKPITLTICGGQAQTPCPTNYVCQLPADVPIYAEGVCVPDN